LNLRVKVRLDEPVTEDTRGGLADWVMTPPVGNEFSAKVPVHFVRSHPHQYSIPLHKSRRRTGGRK